MCIFYFYLNLYLYLTLRDLISVFRRFVEKSNVLLWSAKCLIWVLMDICSHLDYFSSCWSGVWRNCRSLKHEKLNATLKCTLARWKNHPYLPQTILKLKLVTALPVFCFWQDVEKKFDALKKKKCLWCSQKDV